MNPANYRIVWAIHASRLVQIQGTLSEDVVNRLELRAVNWPSYVHSPQARGIPSTMLITETAWIISGPRLVQIQVVLSEVVYVILRTQCHEVFGPRSGCP